MNPNNITTKNLKTNNMTKTILTSRDLFNKFLLETSEEEFNKIIAELQVDNDISPKWSEYLNEFDHIFQL